MRFVFPVFGYFFHLFYSRSYAANFTNLVSSDVCINHAKARVVDLMWSQDDLRGVAIWPEQIIWSNSWMSFPQSPCLIPIDLKGEHPSFELDEKNIVHLILETELVPSLTVMRSDSTAITVSILFRNCFSAIVILMQIHFYARSRITAFH